MEKVFKLNKHVWYRTLQITELAKLVCSSAKALVASEFNQ